MEVAAAQMKAEWEEGISPLPSIRFRSRLRFFTKLMSVFNT